MNVLGPKPVVPSSPGVTARMQRQLRRDTVPEMAVRRGLHAMGLRFRLGWPVPGRPRRSVDIAFPSLRIAVFVDGCFWHGCPEHGTQPRANKSWWAAKLAANVARDRDTDQALDVAAWTVIRVWEHDDTDDVVAAIVEIVRRRRASATLSDTSRNIRS
jgi:DNA mismatch endonuclease, patch repair protein